MTPHRWRRTAFLPLVFVSAAILIACERDRSTPATESVAQSQFIPGKPHDTSERFRAVLVASSGEDAPFSMITGLDVDSQGRIFVADWPQPSVTVLQPDGRYLRSVGRRGSGPGEFGRVSSVQLLPGDSLLVLDRQLIRLTVFPPRVDKAAYTVPLRARHALAVIRRSGGTGYWAWYSAPYTSDTSDPADRPLDILRSLNAEGAIERDSILLFRSAELLVIRSGGGMSVGPHPFGREPYLQVLPDDRLVYAWNDTVGFQVVDTTGRILSRYAEQHTEVPVIDEELKLAEAEVPPAAFEQLQKAAKITWPALVGMVVDDSSRVWLGIRKPHGQPTEWAGFTLDGNYVGSFYLPQEVKAMKIRWPKLYGVSVDELESPPWSSTSFPRVLRRARTHEGDCIAAGRDIIEVARVSAIRET